MKSRLTISYSGLQISERDRDFLERNVTRRAHIDESAAKNATQNHPMGDGMQFPPSIDGIPNFEMVEQPVPQT
jgi:hypothetical protein